MVPGNGKCERVNCRNSDECSQFQSYCTKYNFGDAICDIAKSSCGCNTKGFRTFSCHGSDECLQGLECYPNGECGLPTHCSDSGERCTPDYSSCCSKGVTCDVSPEWVSGDCANIAYVNQSCTDTIHCEEGSDCINTKCSLRTWDLCDFEGAVCPDQTSCRYSGNDKMCIFKY